MPRPKKPDPPTQNVRFRELPSEIAYLLRLQVEDEYELGSAYGGRHAIGDFNRLSKGEQDTLIAKHLGEVIKRDCIQTNGQKWYNWAMESYQSEQRKSLEAWSPQNNPKGL